MTTPLHTGSCRCGQVRMTLSANPVMTSACHCRGCQQMTASAFSLSALVPAAAFQVEGADPVIGGLHDADQRHHFCPHCLSWIFTRITGLEDFVNLRSVLFDGLADLPPFMATCTAEALPWVQTGATVSFAGMPGAAEFFDAMGRFEAQSAG
ncbi:MULTISPECIES: GFA family protein [unclassified Meridianimarinicoccus]|uniref:GFA family protein n=1 Tax=unclassified Meridianimarinicoccus TaxID=2923344 RepID=UPI0018694F68|nr:GFA family protein [Fluviibacterium sp. MJW13]